MKLSIVPSSYHSTTRLGTAILSHPRWCSLSLSCVFLHFERSLGHQLLPLFWCALLPFRPGPMLLSIPLVPSCIRTSITTGPVCELSHILTADFQHPTPTYVAASLAAIGTIALQPKIHMDNLNLAIALLLLETQSRCSLSAGNHKSRKGNGAPTDSAVSPASATRPL